VVVTSPGLDFVILAFATWRISLFLVYGEEFEWLRNLLGAYKVDEDGNRLTYPARVITCLWCMSFLVGLALWTMPSRWVLPFALSGAAIALNHLTRIHRDHG
jgi:hypothetical protein